MTALWTTLEYLAIFLFNPEDRDVLILGLPDGNSGLNWPKMTRPIAGEVMLEVLLIRKGNLVMGVTHLKGIGLINQRPTNVHNQANCINLRRVIPFVCL